MPYGIKLVRCGKGRTDRKEGASEGRGEAMPGGRGRGRGGREVTDRLLAALGLGHRVKIFKFGQGLEAA